MSALDFAPREEGFSKPEKAAPSHAEESVRELVERARRGDTAAFERIYRTHVGRVYAVCLRIHADPDLAEESTQEAFVRAWRKLGSFEGRSALSTWLHRLAVNIALDRKRAAKRRGLEESTDSEETAHALPSPRETPGLGIDLERALASLPPGARTAFVLHDVEGYRHREIAEMTGTAEGTWKAQLHRARRLLREALER